MKPTQQEIIEFAKQAKLGTALSHDGGELRIFIEGADWHEELLRFVELLLERFGAGSGEPVAWAESDEDGEIVWNKESCFSDDPDWLDNPMPLYTHPSPTDLRAEYERGLEDAATLCDGVSLQANAAWKLAYKPQDQGREMGADECADAIRALKGKQ